MPVDSTPHLIAAFAGCSPGTWLQADAPLEPKNLGKLLRGMKLVQTHTGAAASLSPPHERVLAEAFKLFENKPFTDGLLPWAALAAQSQGLAAQQAWGFITLCHWSMGREHATLTDPAALEITLEESRTLLAAMQPYFATVGITLHYQNNKPGCWLAEGAVFEHLPTASLDRALGRNVDPLLPDSKAIKLLQNEMQMLLYSHAINDARGAAGQRTINSFWLSGTGALAAGATGTEDAATNPAITVCRSLAQAAFTDDWAAFAAGWAQLDATQLAKLLALQQSGQTVRISLCGEANAVTFETAAHSIFSKIKSAFKLQSMDYLLKQL